MNGFLFPAPEPVSVAILGESVRFAVRRIFCVGQNYAAHAREMGAAPDTEAPFYFTKSAYAYAPSGATIPYPSGTQDFQHEVELVVAIGTAAASVARAHALEAVYGYGVGLDMTRRDLQRAAKEKRRPWDTSKDFANAAVLSAIVPAAQCGHPQSGAISLSVNGDVRQRGDLADMIHRVDEIIADLSRYYDLLPGDLIYTGTPEGVGPVSAGDVIGGAVEGVGEVTLTIAR